jgi:predicted transcriptional regulator
MTTPTKGAPKRGPGRPRRSDGLDPSSEAARKARGIGTLKVRLPDETLAILDEIAETLGVTRTLAVQRLIVDGLAKGWAPRAAQRQLEHLEATGKK